jgi:hypothetical protein
MSIRLNRNLFIIAVSAIYFLLYGIHTVIYEFHILSLFKDHVEELYGIQSNYVTIIVLLSIECFMVSFFFYNTFVFV